MPEASYGELKEVVMSVVGQHFRPEFINRIDETVVFHSLGQEHIRSIARIQLERLIKQMTERGYEVTITDAAIDHISNTGFDPLFGARPLKRAIQQVLENPLAQQILGGQLLPNRPVLVDYQNDHLVIENH